MPGSARASVDVQNATREATPAFHATRPADHTSTNRQRAAWNGNQSRLRHLSLQPKLAIGATNDPLEVDAERTAEHVMRMPAPIQTHRASVPGTTSRAPIGAGVVRRCSCGGSCDECKAKQASTPSKLDDLELRRKPSGTAPIGEAPSSVHQVLRSSGAPLDRATRAFFEPRFGQDFSDVRIHSGADAAESAREVNALAYTVGSNVVFGSHRLAPQTADGQRLLAHELTHVVQQRSRGQSVAPYVRRAALASTPQTPPVRQPNPGAGCYGADVDGPGRVKQDGANQWVLSNFDVDQHYVKKRHFDFLKNVVAPKINSTPAGKYQVRIVGEASTTADFAYNLDLSARRAECVAEELVSAGLDDEHRPNIITQTGELRGDIEQLLEGIDPRIGIEDSRKRMVTISLVPAGECTRETRSRSSDNFYARIACVSPSEIRINIGVNDPAQPIYREFAWFHDPWPHGCMFIPGYPPDFSSHIDFVETSLKLRLANDDPDQMLGPSDFAGEITFLGYGANVSLVKGGFFPLFRIGLGGTWNPDSCGQKPQSVDGALVPFGPVKCGWAPAPPGHCDFTEEECSDTHKMAASKRFNGHLEGSSFSLKGVVDRVTKELPPWAQMLVSVAEHFIDPGGVAFRIKFGTRDSSVAPGLTRSFVFLGVGGQGGGKGITGHVKFAVAPDQDATQPSRLANEDPDSITAGSDLSTLHGKLVIEGDSNKIELTTGAGTFNFFAPDLMGILCNHGGTRTYYGTLLPAWSVNCPDHLELPDVSEEECKDKEKCPESTRTAGHKEFTVKVGRATLASLPLAGRRLAKQLGCRYAAAFLNIQSEDGPKDQQIHREFLVLLNQDNCQFNVARGDSRIATFLDHHLATEDPEEIFAPSDFIPVAHLTNSGDLWLISDSNTPLKFKLPGIFDSGCPSGSDSSGIAIPVSGVGCGEAPQPAHDSTSEKNHTDECNQFRKQHADFVNTLIDLIREPEFQNLFARLSPGAAVVPPDEYLDYTRQVGNTISPAVFVGLAPNPHGGQPIPVVAFADMQIIRVYRNGWMQVQFLSDVCAFDQAGNVVLIRPRQCLENFAHLGEIGMIQPMQDLPPNKKVPPPKRNSP